MSADFPTLEPIILEARKRLDQGAWDFLVGGSESETTFRRNRSAFDRLAFRPRVLRDVSAIDASTTLLGHNLRIPVLTAPVGALQRFTPGGAADAVAAAAAFGIVPVVSSASEPALEDSAAITDAPRWFQLYIRGDLQWCREMVERIEAAGYSAFVLTVDTAVPSRRERPLISGTTPPRPAAQTNYQALMTWDFVDQLRELTTLPFIIKGIQTAEDAALAVEHGVDAVWASNHGGRQLDHALGTLDTLPEIVAAVAGRARIISDGGINRGSDILKAIALGADAVAIGRLQAWGLAAAGQPGLTRVLEILEHELHSAMGLLGVTSLDQLTPDYLAPADPVTPPHEISSWPNIPGARIP
jgi:isopentenyl diphosphate isomerase/L-lactate dehydrogenase-like FMN-dependent dehydrogenase